MDGQMANGPLRTAGMETAEERCVAAAVAGEAAGKNGEEGGPLSVEQMSNTGNGVQQCCSAELAALPRVLGCYGSGLGFGAILGERKGAN